jgi:hypothetical protein
MFAKKEKNNPWKILVNLTAGYLGVLTNCPGIFPTTPLHVFVVLWLMGVSVLFYLYNILNLNQLCTRCLESDFIRKLLLYIC